MEARDFVAALIAKGLTQSEIATRTGIQQPTLSKVLRGEVDDVMSRNYRKLQHLHDEVVGGVPPAGEGAAPAGDEPVDDVPRQTRSGSDLYAAEFEHAVSIQCVDDLPPEGQTVPGELHG